MSLDLDKLFEPLSEDQPSGGDLEYDATFLEMLAAAEAKPERQMGDSIIEAEEPEWKVVKSKALEVCERTKDIRALVLLANAAARTDGFGAMRDVLRALHQVLADFWPTIHPQLDPDDQDPMMRANAAAALADPDGLVKTLRETPLVESKVVGRFSMRDIELAESGRGDADAPTPDLIAAAFMDVDVEVLQETEAALEGAREASEAIDAKLTEEIGGQAPDLRPLLEAIDATHQELRSRLSMRGVGEEPDSEGGDADGGGGGAGGHGSGVNNRQDVVRHIDLICDYYRRVEPSSPVPVLLERARRLVDMSFLDVVRDLLPAGLDQAQQFEGQSDSYSE